MKGRRRGLHRVDGRWITIADAAEQLGVSVDCLYNQRKRRGLNLQAIMDGYRNGEIHTGVRGCPVHRVHGRRTTVRHEAMRLGVNIGTLESWRSIHRHEDGSRALLEEAVDHYQGLKDGTIQPQRHGFAPRKHFVRGKPMTIAEAAEMLGMSERAMRHYLSYHKCKLETAVLRIEERKQASAVKSILDILGV